MPTARELLEQAEALMLRERSALMSDDIPTLTDSVPISGDGLVGSAALDARGAPTSLEDIPMLTEAVEDFDTPSIPLAQSLDDELAIWREADDASILVAAPAATTATPEVAVVEEGTLESPEMLAAIEAPIAKPAPEATSIEAAPMIVEAAPMIVESPPMIVEAAPMVDDSARWNALAEDIRMQVLQRIDIFTDTGLKDQLNQRLQPIVDRASADLVAAINQHVGQLLRAYVAEAIEREIEKWRENSR
jgi:hypothetical protein